MNRKPAQNNEGQSATGCSDWSALPVEILDIIVDKLQHFGDRLSLASVCKDWRIPVTPRPLPWVVTFAGEHVFFGTSRSVTITFEFHEICSNANEPCQLRPYKRSLEMPTCGDRFQMTPCHQGVANWGRLYTPYSPADDLLVRPRIEESKSGWLVVSMSYNRFIGEELYQLDGETLFVCNPFSARSMSLPDLQHKPYTITFSGSDPISPDCVFFMIVCEGENFSIHSWSPGQEEVWKERHVVAKDHDWSGCCSVTWLDGIFYWCNNTQMESFNPSNGERNKIFFRSLLAGVSHSDIYNKLYEVNGEMLLLVYHLKPIKRSKFCFKFNPFEGTWISGDDCLNDRLLFVSGICPSSYSVSGYGITSSCRIFTSYNLSNQYMKKKTHAVECLMMDCLAKTGGAIKCSNVEWLAPPLKTFG